MNYSLRGVIKIIGFICLAVLITTGCATKRKKGETGKVGLFFHNLNSKYNGYFNANELLEKTLITLEESGTDNYYKLLDIYPYNDPQNVKSISPDMDIAIEKVTTVATLHEPSHWVDDCYVLMGKAQYLKQDYETAEETLEYFQEEFDPGNPFGRTYDKNKGKKTKKQVTKEREAERELKKKEKEEERKAKEEAREKEKKERDELSKKRKKESKKRSGGKKKRTRKKVTEETHDDASKEAAAVIPTDKEASAAQSSPKPTEDDDDEVDNNNRKAKSKTPKITRYPKGDAGLFKHAPAFYEGVLWLSKTYMEREKYSYAEYLLNKLENEYPSSKDVKNALPAARAHLAIKQNKYNDAISYLEDAIDKDSNKKRKARYAYIIGQMHQIQNNPLEAIKAFEHVKSHKPSHEMEFNATLKIAALKNQTNTGEKDIEKEVEKLLKEAKYNDFKDQIYYTLGEIKFIKNDRPGAIEAFEESLNYSVGNINQQTETYYKLATLLYEKEDYVNAKVHYDNALKVMDKYDSRYQEVTKYSANLTDIAKNIEFIALQDSLMAIAQMSEEEQRVLAQKLYEEEKLNPNKNPDAKEESPLKNMAPIRKSGLNGVSSFFAYNIAAKVKGQQLFTRKWGDRNLEDNWRRSNKFSNDLSVDDPSKANDQILEVEKELTDAEIKRLLKDVPFGINEQVKTNKLLKDALFSLGVDFRDAIQNYESSVKTHGKLEMRFPKSDHELEAFYYQYLSYTDLNNPVKANEYKAKIISAYPESTFAKILLDPSYAQELASQKKSVENYYNETYDIFNTHDYNTTIARIDNADTLFTDDNQLKAKFALLRAMSVGSIEGKDSYISALKNVSSKYPDTPEDTRAKEIMRFLRGDTEAFDKAIYDEASETFKLDDNKLHYVIAVLYDSNEAKKRDAKLSISAYNKKYHKADKLRITDIFLNAQENTQIILIRKFKDKKDAMDYYNKINLDPAEFIEKGISYDLFAVTQKNYREIIKEKSTKNYRVFFELNYLNDR